jgi:hypothetical protein
MKGIFWHLETDGKEEGQCSQNNWLNVENASTPDLPVKRYLLNNVHYLSANYLTNIDKKKNGNLKPMLIIPIMQ